MAFAQNIRVFQPIMLKTRIMTILGCADAGNFMNALKIVNRTIYNLSYALTPRMNDAQVDIYISYLATTAMYANRQDAATIKTNMMGLLSLLTMNHENLITCTIAATERVPNPVCRDLSGLLNEC